MSLPIAIIGAGQAGLTLARLLYIKNIHFIVFEQNAMTDPEGFWATLDINPEAAQVVLKEAGLFDEFSALASFDTQVIALADHHGEIITLSETKDLPRIDWEDFRTMLLDSIPAEKIRWSTRVDSVEKVSDGSVSLHLDNGSSEHGFKLVVGADGRNSIVRPEVSIKAPAVHKVVVLNNADYICQSPVLRYHIPPHLCFEGKPLLDNGGRQAEPHRLHGRRSRQANSRNQR